ncbi:MAG: hypothetical protein ATN35_04370 [Epulopiscium sp. Nele67-Bin004]|nr:MAG: hypothetical protein ATN35_04370 [Epulopiscium sp. Nele67-Bin004]
MSVELMQRLVDVTEATKKETSQIVKERDLIVPDGKPDVQKVLLLDGKIRMDQIDVQSNRVVYKGQIEVSILYMPEDQAAGVSKMTGSIPLEDFMILEGLEADQRVDFSYEIENMHWNLLNERKLNVKTIIELKATNTAVKELAMIEDLKTDEPIQKRMDTLDIVNMMPYKEEKIIIKDELTVPQGKPAVAEIIKTDTAIKDEQIRRTADEIVFNGMVELSILYRGTEAGRLLEVVHHKIPFSGAIDFPKDEDEIYWDCELEVSPTYIQVNPDYDGEDRIIEAECIVTAKYTTYNNEKTEVVSDIYCPGKKVKSVDKLESYVNLVHKENVRVPKKESVQLTGLSPEDQQIYNVGIKAKVEDKILEGDKLTIEGILEIEVCYVDQQNSAPINSYLDIVPFEISIPVQTGSGKNIVDVDVKPKEVQTSSFTRDMLGLEYVLEYLVNVYEQKEMRILEEVEFEDMSKEELSAYPSIIVYTVKPGENLWDMAKRFNTTVADIAQVNEVEANYQPRQGEKVIIVKKNKF